MISTVHELLWDKLDIQKATDLNSVSFSSQWLPKGSLWNLVVMWCSSILFKIFYCDSINNTVNKGIGQQFLHYIGLFPYLIYSYGEDVVVVKNGTRELSWLGNKQFQPGVKYKVLENIRWVDQEHKPALQL